MAKKNVTLSAQKLAQERTDWAYERTHMAATRTFFALLRTGLAIAGGGTLVTSMLAQGWPDWVVGLLSAIFIVVGFTIMLGGLHRYHRIAKRLAVEEELDTIPLGLVTTLTILLQAATVAVLILFLIG